MTSNRDGGPPRALQPALLAFLLVIASLRPGAARAQDPAYPPSFETLPVSTRPPPKIYRPAFSLSKQRGGVERARVARRPSSAAPGEFIDAFVTAASGGLSRPWGLTFGPDGDFYVASDLSDAVLVYDGADGSFLGVFGDASGPGSGLVFPTGLTFGPDGHLYVSSFGTSEVLVYEGGTGVFLGVFGSASFPGSRLSRPYDVRFGPGDDLYVASLGSDQVKVYDGRTGFLLRDITSPEMNNPTALAFGPLDGLLYTANGTEGSVLRYAPSTGAFVDTFIPAGSNGLTTVFGLSFDEAGRLYVASLDTDAVQRYAPDRSFLGVFGDASLPGSGLNDPFGLLFGGNFFYVASGLTNEVLRYQGPVVTDLAVTKTVDDPEPGFGDTVVFTVALANNGPEDATDVEVTDLLPAGLTLARVSAGRGAYDAATGRWAVGALAAGVRAALTLDAVVDTLAPVTNTATLTGSTPGDADPGNNTASVTIRPQAADLRLDKTVDDAAPAVGAPVTFTITVAHDGGGDVASIRVDERLPDGLRYAGHAAGQGVYDPATGAWRVGALRQGQAATLDVTAEVTTTAPVTNTAFIAFATLFDPVPGNNADAASLNAVAADLELTKTLIGRSTRDGIVEATFLVTVANEGPAETAGVEVTDHLSPDMTLAGLSVSRGAILGAAPAVTWAVGTLGVGDAATMTVTVSIPEGGNPTNTAEVTAAGLPDPDSTPGDGRGDDFAGATAGGRATPDFVPGGGPGGVVNRGNRFTADLALTKAVDNAVPPVGAEVVYTIVVENLGPQATTRVTATDHWPDCLAFVASSADQGAYAPDTGTWTVGRVRAGHKATLALTGRVTEACSGTVTNRAEITASSLPDPGSPFALIGEPQPTLENNRDAAAFTVAGAGRASGGTRVALGLNYPNPFNPQTVIPFTLAEATRVRISVYDLLGRPVATLADGDYPAGVHEVVFEAGRLATGVYLIRMEAAGVVRTRPITFMK